ncbi:hypothetical protein [Metallosphaera hakonensis]|nr:hypothetical protein [Metallosphaera hakonensis]
MDFAIWLDGVVLDVDTTDSLYMNYKGNKVAVPLMMRVQNDWLHSTGT